MTVNSLHRLDHRVESVIANNPHVRARSLSIATEGSRVVLEGEVDSYFAKQMAQESLRSINGLTHIENRLTVVWNQPT